MDITDNFDLNKRKQQFRESARRRCIATQSLDYDSSEEEVDLDQCALQASDEDYDTREEEDNIRVESLQYGPEMDEPVYEGSSVTVRNTILIILYFVISCNLAVTYVSKLLILLHYLLLEDNNLKHTKYLFFKYFNNSARDMKRFHSCRTCRKLVPDCSVCSECEQVIDCHFLAQKPSELLINRLQDREYWNKCQYFIHNFKYNRGTCSDIYDGSTYKNIGFEVSKNKGDFNFYLNTDGGTKYKSPVIGLYDQYIL
jgi:hypothetical protein